VASPEPGIYTIEEPLHVESVKSYLVVGSERAVLIDTGMGVADIRALVETLTDVPVMVLNSHSHWDHIGGSHAFAGASEIMVHPAGEAALRRGVDNIAMRAHLAADQLLGSLPDGFDYESVTIPGANPTRLLNGGEIIDLGGRQLEILHTPGHCADLLVAFDRANNVLFSTDAAYAGALYAQLAGSDLDAYAESLQQLSALVPAIRAVYPSHGPSPIEPALIPRMQDAVTAAAAGKPPDRIAGGVGIKDYEDFSLLVKAELAGESSEC